LARDQATAQREFGQADTVSAQELVRIFTHRSNRDTRSEMTNVHQQAGTEISKNASVAA
jgi:hypothetical protein